MGRISAVSNTAHLVSPTVEKLCHLFMIFIHVLLGVKKTDPTTAGWVDARWQMKKPLSKPSVVAVVFVVPPKWITISFDVVVEEEKTQTFDITSSPGFWKERKRDWCRLRYPGLSDMSAISIMRAFFFFFFFGVDRWRTEFQLPCPHIIVIILQRWAAVFPARFLSMVLARSSVGP